MFLEPKGARPTILQNSTGVGFKRGAISLLIVLDHKGLATLSLDLTPLP